MNDFIIISIVTVTTPTTMTNRIPLERCMKTGTIQTPPINHTHLTKMLEILSTDICRIARIIIEGHSLLTIGGYRTLVNRQEGLGLRPP